MGSRELAVKAQDSNVRSKRPVSTNYMLSIGANLDSLLQIASAILLITKQHPRRQI
jgi:hypothetical protein